jgi:hypothetical protein
MKDVQIILAHVFDALMDISKDFDLKSDTLGNDELCVLRSDIAKLEELVAEAGNRAAGHQVTTLYAIGKETAPGEYAGFTHGPHPDRNEMAKLGSSLDDGDALVRIMTSVHVVNYVSEQIWFENQWNETGDEPGTFEIEESV